MIMELTILAKLANQQAPGISLFPALPCAGVEALLYLASFTLVLGIGTQFPTLPNELISLLPINYFPPPPELIM